MLGQSAAASRALPPADSVTRATGQGQQAGWAGAPLGVGGSDDGGGGDVVADGRVVVVVVVVV
ncbi:MAG TPA: hypothetical protein VI854_05680, partial [Acidimicrobiia bacterium]|nr:hypothetical protein [Acidimicrobiia bacterium]